MPAHTLRRKRSMELARDLDAISRDDATEHVVRGTTREAA